MLIETANTPEQIRLCYPVIAQLRPHLNFDQFHAAFIRMRRQGCVMIYLVVEEEVTSVAIYRLMELLSTGNILYIDDLVTSEAHRSRGYAAQMLKFIKQIADSAECKYIELDSGANRKDAHRFYTKAGFESVALHFSLAVGAQDKWVENS